MDIAQPSAFPRLARSEFNTGEPIADDSEGTPEVRRGIGAKAPAHFEFGETQGVADIAPSGQVRVEALHQSRSECVVHLARYMLAGDGLDAPVLRSA